jgi:putative DNA methylase
MTYKKKLIEVALPLDAINKASGREKSIRHGHPSTLHLWWARRPLATARAVIFAQMVDDPSGHPDLFPTEKAQEKERQRLFKIIEDLVLWENTTNEEVLQQARDEIWQSWRRTCAENADHLQAKELFNRNKLPAFHDPFAGGGALPLEAQRLGLESYASDLNPVAVLINKAMIEIPPKFAGKPPVHPWEKNTQQNKGDEDWKGAQGLVEDVRYYGQWMRDEAEKRIGHLYPKAVITTEMMQGRPDLEKYKGRKLTVIAWLWARTVKCPNPACACDMPLLSSLVLSSKKKRPWYIDPVIKGKRIYFRIQDKPPNTRIDPKKGFKRGVSAIFECAFCETVTTRNYVSQQATEIGLGSIQTGVVAEGDKCRIYLPAEASPIPVEIPAANCVGLDVELSSNPRDVWCRNFGLLRPMDLFTPRQLVALTTFSSLAQEARDKVFTDAKKAGWQKDGIGLDIGGTGATAYAEAVGLYLAFSTDKCADYWSSICSWHSSGEKMRNTFGRQAIPMTWDYAEANPFSSSSGNWKAMLDWTWKALLTTPANKSGFANQSDAQNQSICLNKIISTDPPYYDNIGYADLSDFFYVWLRRSLKPIFPSLFATLSVPKAEELVAAPYRQGSKAKAESFFLEGMTQAMHRLAEQMHPLFPVTIYYAFKQSEARGGDGIASTGWDTFLEAVIKAGFSITGTWPMRTELANKLIGANANMLASSIVLVCQPQADNSPTATRGEFVAALKTGLPKALIHLQRGNIEPVDLAQAIIGPGMAIYTRYTNVIDVEGNPLSVRQALALINQTLDEVLAEQEGDFDADSQWAITWFEQFGFSEADFGKAEQLSKSKNTSVGGLVEAGIIFSKPGKKVRLWKPSELPDDWDPDRDNRLTNWEMAHHLIRELEASGESAAAKIMAKLGSKAEIARELCYRLYNLCERKKRAKESLSYNALVQSWPEIVRLARSEVRPRNQQTDFLDDSEE